MTVDRKAKAEVLEQLCKLRLLLTYEAMIQAKALWLERPVERAHYYADYTATVSEWQQAEIEYLAARRDLIRWGVVV